MLYGEQWVCPCGYRNFIGREVCKNCGGSGLNKTREKSESDLINRMFGKADAMTATMADEDIIKEAQGGGNE